MNSFEIIKTARLTEKGTRQGSKYNQYTLVADRRASKPQIKRVCRLGIAPSDLKQGKKSRRRNTLADSL